MMPFTMLTAANWIAQETYREIGLFQPSTSAAALERTYANEQSEFVQVGDARVHYRDEGNPDGETIVLLHGTYSSLHTWDGWLAELGVDFRLVRLDMPGFGLTGPRKTDRQTVEGLVRTVSEFCDTLSLTDVTVAGNSLGGGIAWRLATKRPDLVSKLILINAGGATLLSTLSTNLVMFTTEFAQRYLTPRMIVRLILYDAYYDKTKLSESLIRRYHDLLLRPGNRGAVVEIARNYKDDHFEEGEYAFDQSFPRLPSGYAPEPQVWDDYDIADVSVPTLFQWGCEDEWLPCAFGRELADPVADSEFVVYDRVGHIAMEEDPVRTAADAAAFITGEPMPYGTDDCDCA